MQDHTHTHSSILKWCFPSVTNQMSQSGEGMSYLICHRNMLSWSNKITKWHILLLIILFYWCTYNNLIACLLHIFSYKVALIRISTVIQPLSHDMTYSALLALGGWITSTVSMDICGIYGHTHTIALYLTVVNEACQVSTALMHCHICM